MPASNLLLFSFLVYLASLFATVFPGRAASHGRPDLGRPKTFPYPAAEHEDLSKRSAERHRGRHPQRLITHAFSLFFPLPPGLIPPTVPYRGGVGNGREKRRKAHPPQKSHSIVISIDFSNSRCKKQDNAKALQTSLSQWMMGGGCRPGQSAMICMGQDIVLLARWRTGS